MDCSFTLAVCLTNTLTLPLSVDPSSRRDIIAQFGRVTDTTFHLDFKRPLCAFQAFGMALAQFNL